MMDSQISADRDYYDYESNSLGNEMELEPIRPADKASSCENENSSSENEESLPEGICLDPCIVSEEIQLEEGIFPAAFDPADEHPGIYTANEESQALDVEKKLNESLRQGDYDAIAEQVTPKILASCKTNALLKAFEVNKILSNSADSGVNPEKDEIETLVNSVNEYTSALINPLKSDNDTRNTFQSCFDYVVDKAIDAEQKKFLSHPVVYNLLNSRWYRSFTSVRKEPWTSPSRWGYFFLNLWPVLDIFLFPFLFACFFVFHLIKQLWRKTRETEVCFVVTLSKDTTEEAFTLIKRTVSYIIHKYGYHSVNYCLILRDENDALGNINFEVVCPSKATLLKKVEEVQKSGSIPQLYEDLCAARDSFKSSKVRKDAKKILVVFVNDTLNMVGARDKPLTPLLDELKALGVKVVPVGIGEHAKLSELNEMASKNVTALHFGEYESPRKLGKAIVQDVEGKDIYEKYLDYFTTPYFIFFRDTLSYLTLLGLHFAICLSPSTVAFSRLEWVILIFFLGRILTEFDQFMSGTKHGRKRQSRHKSLHGSTYEVCTPVDEKNGATSSDENVVMKRFSNYFSDRWNMLDFIILVFYVITFTLRMITWSTSTEVSDNRPLAVAGYFYGLIAMFLTLRAFGHVMECMRGMGAIQIALFFIMWDVLAIFWQFLATILAFSLAMTKIYVAEKSYSKSDEDLACAEDGFTCWWIMAKHLAWSLLGLADLDSIDSVDHPSVTLVYLLYSLFLIMGVVLLVNMMIALLSNTYQRVQENSLKEWSFKKAITIKTYSSYHPVPVPFNLVSIPLMAICKRCRKCVCMKFDESDLNESGRKTALDKVVKKLETIYFATYGYSFPLTDERKMDHLLHETDGSRRMASQIVRQVFRQRGSEREKLITGASAWESLGIGIDGCLLTYKGPDFCDVCKGKQPKSVHGARYLMPFTPEVPRIEGLIQESGERRIIGVGVVYERYNCHMMPGWVGGTVGYHVDDGRIFERGCDELGREVGGAMAYRGDLITCEVDFDDVKNGSITIVFSLNGKEVARASMEYTTGQTILFPFISLGYEGIHVLVKMCPRDSSGIMVQYRSIKGPGTEHELMDYVQKQHHKLREYMADIEEDRIGQARKFQQQLDDQWKMLTEIKNLVLRLNEGRQKDEEADENVKFT
ncbi:hypothetical protein ACROYT_G006693 [Oculina patagonica]